MAAAADHFKFSANQAVEAQHQKNQPFADRLRPLAGEIGTRVSKAVSYGNEFAQERRPNCWRP